MIELAVIGLAMTPREAKEMSMKPGIGSCESMQRTMEEMGHPEIACNTQRWHRSACTMGEGHCCAYVMSGAGDRCKFGRRCDDCDDPCIAIKIIQEAMG